VVNGVARLRVTDNGVGFDPQSHKRGLGLASIRERARLLGGNVRFQSEPGAGTEVTVEVPVGDEV
jgi:signal transduction histidine kinase